MTTPIHSAPHSLPPRAGVYLAHHSANWQEWVNGVRLTRACSKGSSLRAYGLQALELHNTQRTYSKWHSGSGQICQLLRYSLLEDESSWARAMLLVLINSLFEEGRFEAVIQKIYEAVKAFSYNNPQSLQLNQHANDAIGIFYEMRNMTQEERIAHLNHERIDETLIFFVRHLSGEYMRRYDSNISTEYASAVKLDRHLPSSGYEPLAFCSSLQLEFNQVVRSQGQWQLAHKAPLETGLSYIDLDMATLPSSCEIFFPVNESHCEYLSLAPVSIQTPPTSQLAPTALPQLVIPTQISLKQIFEDFLLLLAFRGVEVDFSLIETQLQELQAYQTAWKQMQTEENLAHKLFLAEQNIALKKTDPLAGISILPSELSQLSLPAQKRVQQMQKRRTESAQYRRESWIQRLPKALTLCMSQLLCYLKARFVKPPQVKPQQNNRR